MYCYINVGYIVINIWQALIAFPKRFTQSRLIRSMIDHPKNVRLTRDKFKHDARLLNTRFNPVNNQNSEDGRHNGEKTRYLRAILRAARSSERFKAGNQPTNYASLFRISFIPYTGNNWNRATITIVDRIGTSRYNSACPRLASSRLL